MAGGLFGGDAWTKNHEGILDHARNLRYDDYLAESGGALPSTDADKAAWTSAMDKFNAWKAREVAKQDSGQAWWQTYEAPSEGGSGGDSGGGGGLLTNPGTGIGPYPADNMYFPQLTHAYEAPQAQDWSQYLPSWINGPLSQMGGLLYQPGTQEYMEQFPMPENIWNYQPPQINRQPVQYSVPPMGGLMEVIMPADDDKDKDEEEYDPNKDIGWDEGGGGTGSFDNPSMHGYLPVAIPGDFRATIADALVDAAVDADGG